MPSSNRAARAWFTTVRAALSAALVTVAAAAEPLAAGFAAERFSPASPGAGWLTLDDLRLTGGLGAGLTVTSGYARRPYSIHTPGGSRIDVIADQAFLDVGMAVLYDRYRFSLNITDPLYATGRSGTAAGYRFEAPLIDPGKYPDKVTDIRIGLDSRAFGAVDAPLRLGLSARLWLPSGERSLYASDGTLRVVVRALLAGDLRPLTYSGHIGVHLRSLDESRVPGAPRGSELLFALGVGPAFTLSEAAALRASVGPELWGATALQSAFRQDASCLEALLGARVQHVGPNGASTSVKVGFGEGIQTGFGTPEWRAVVSIEAHGRAQ